MRLTCLRSWCLRLLSVMRLLSSVASSWADMVTNGGNVIGYKDHCIACMRSGVRVVLTFVHFDVVPPGVSVLRVVLCCERAKGHTA